MTPAAGTGKRLFLIDGNSLLYRSYYAIRGLTNSKGFPTNAIYGFLSTLRKLMGTEKPDYLGIVFDTKGPTLRHQAFKDYKAHRKPMPEDLVVQVPVLKELIAALRIPLYESPDYEADDILASLARIAGGRGIHSIIVTTDKDLLQVVDAETSVYNPSKEITLDEAGVKEFFGVEAARVADVLALQGDQSDNIPGVPGIGEKTARSLIDEFGTLERLLADTSRIRNPKVREKIEQNLDTLELSRQLVTVERGLDLAFDLQDFAPCEPDAAEAARIFKELEFASLLAEFVKNAPGAAPEIRDPPRRRRARGPGRRSEEGRELRPRHGDRQPVPDKSQARRDVVRHDARGGFLHPAPARLPRCPGPDPRQEGPGHPQGGP